jgi:2-deoxy-D-gluconate 3-dehydrogenase
VSANFSLAGKRALVTGASRGLGRAMALALAAAGADVACAASTEERAEATAKEIRGLGREAWAFGADLSARSNAEALASDVGDAVGVVDVLLNAAGTIRRTPATEFSDADWDLVLRTNLDSTWILSQRIGRGMVQRGSGKIINVASLLSFSGGVLVPAYTASKHAVAGLTKALANEWGGRGVQVNAIAPGYFRTDVTQALQDDPVRSKEIQARIPAGRWGEPSDIGGVAVFLASSASDYVNGHVLVVDGGWMAR